MCGIPLVIHKKAVPYRLEQKAEAEFMRSPNINQVGHFILASLDLLVECISQKNHRETARISTGDV